MPVAKKANTGEIVVVPMQVGIAHFCILGTSPFVFNAVSQKAMMEFLLPRSGKMSAGMKATRLKHNPLEEYQNSVYSDPREKAPTFLQFPAGSFKKATASAALDMPTSVKKAQIGRLVWTSGETSAWVPMWGRPQLYMAVVKSSDIARTPDIRTRAILDRWATKITLRYVVPNLSYEAVGTLLAAAGTICGVGDGRQEKGSLSNGQFTICGEDDPEFLDIQKEGRAIQKQAMESPEMYDATTASLYEWFVAELGRRRDKQHVEEVEEPLEMEPA